MRYDITTDQPDDEINFAEVLTALWGEGAVSLSGAVWWIATGGEPEPDCNDESLELAAKALVRAALDGRITIFGQNKVGDTLAIAPETLGKALNVETFTGSTDDDFLFFKGRVLCWQFDLSDEVFSDEKGDGDTINDRDIVLWRHLFVRMIDIERIWPKAGESSAVETDSTPLKPKRRTKAVKMSEFMRSRFDHDPGKSCPEWRDYSARNGLFEFDRADDDTILRAARLAWPPAK
jgi:hypothetical protein